MWRGLGLSVCIAALGVGCTANHYRKSADKEASSVIAEKTPLVPNMDTNFTIETEPKFDVATLPAYNQVEEALWPESTNEIGARVLTLDESLDIAVGQSRQYQNQKEIVFLQALQLTLARWNYTPIFNTQATAEYQTRVLDVTEEIEQIIGQQIIRQQQLVQQAQHSVNMRGNVGMNMLTRTGGRIALAFTTDVLQFITSGGNVRAGSSLSATFAQPLLRGRGYKIAMENLTQAERDVLYALRQFVQFRQNFSVQVASAYYGVLQNREEMRNSWRGLVSFRQNVERERAFAAEGQRTQTALGQLQQAELSTETSWVNAVRQYRASLDNFKILIGLSTDTPIVLDEGELAKLKIAHPDVPITEAIQVALTHRLDLYSTRDQFEDAARQVDVAKNFLKPELDLVLRGNVDSESGKPFAMDFERARWSAGLDTDFGLNRKQERNSYRSSLISYERAARELELAVDQIKLDVQENWRALDQARRNYDIARIGVELSERRVEEQELLAELGRGTARDLVDARLDLINARNQLTSALVQHTIARLQFWRDLGILHIRDDGKWEEVQQYVKQ